MPRLYLACDAARQAGARIRDPGERDDGASIIAWVDIVVVPCLDPPGSLSDGRVDRRARVARSLRAAPSAVVEMLEARRQRGARSSWRR